MREAKATPEPLDEPHSTRPYPQGLSVRDRCAFLAMRSRLELDHREPAEIDRACPIEPQAETRPAR